MSDRIVGHLSQIPKGEGRNYQIEGRPIAIFHTHAGEVFATQANCPHRNGPLADGLTDSGTVICPLHERVFDLRTGEERGAGCRLATYRVRVGDDGAILFGD